MTLTTCHRAHSRRRAHRRPVRRLRRSPGAQARRADASTSPSRGAASTSCTHKIGEQIYYDAPDYAHAYAMRADTFPADGEFPGSDPDLAFKQLIMEAGADIAILEPAAYPARFREANHAMSRAHSTTGRPTTGWTATTTGTSAGAGRSASPSRTPDGARPRDREVGRASLHGPDPDQGRAAAVMGPPEVRPDLGGRHQARHHRELPPVPRPPRGAADPAGRIPQLQPRLHGHLLAAGGEPGDEPDLRRRLRPLPDAANRVGGARVHLDPAADVADGRDLRGAQVVGGHQAQAVGVRQGPHQVHHPAAGLSRGQDRADPRASSGWSARRSCCSRRTTRTGRSTIRAGWSSTCPSTPARP